jgi:hypothetical protein
VKLEALRADEALLLAGHTQRDRIARVRVEERCLAPYFRWHRTARDEVDGEDFNPLISASLGRSLRFGET